MPEQRVGNGAVGKLTRGVGDYFAVSAAGLQGRSWARRQTKRWSARLRPRSLGVRSPPVGQDEHDIPIEPDEKPKTCGDLLCDVSIEPPRKLKRSHRAVSRDWRDKKWEWLPDGTALRKKVLCRQGQQWKSTCAKCCPKRPGALHRLLAETRIERDDVSHREKNEKTKN